MRKNTLTVADIGDAFANLNDFACKIAAKDCRPLLNEKSKVLPSLITWINSDCVSLDQNLSRPRSAYISCTNSELMAHAVDPCCLVRHRHRGVGVFELVNKCKFWFAASTEFCSKTEFESESVLLRLRCCNEFFQKGY